MSAGEAAPRRERVAESTGRYQVGEQLAVGGMGTIYRAYDTLARRELAYKRLKISNESARPRLTALFEREYNALRQLKHPNIVEVYDYGVDAEGPFYTMELLLGQDLAQVAPLPLTEACRIVRDVASALALLHARRLVHRDVTPANIRITDEGRAKLIDFGALSEFGVAKEIVGTPAFIAPECLSGEALDARTDLFALGAVAYWALTRRHACPARSIGELLDVWKVPCAKPSLHVAELPKELDELVLSLLEREPVARPSSAAHVIERLTAIANLAPELDEERVAYSYLMHPPLVGRAVVLDQLQRFLAEAAEGRGRAVLIEAAAGLGRSALLDQLAINAQLSGANVLRLSPSGSRDAGLAQSIAQWVRAVFPELWRDELARNPVFSRETRAPLRAGPSPTELAERREKLLVAMQRCVEQISAAAPLTLLVDDVQRADAESLALLASLARGASTSRFMLVLTREDRGAGSGGANALSELSAVATSLVLRPLAQRDVEQLAQTVFGNVPNVSRLARFLHLQSGGNPAQCMDLCRLLLQEQQIRYALGTFSLPFDPRSNAGAEALQLTRLAELSPVALGFVRLLSLHDSALGAEQGTSALACAPEQLLAAREELSARGLVHVSEGDCAIASESLRQAVRRALPADELKTLHAALSQCILARGDGGIELKLQASRHLLSAGCEDEAIALVWEPLQRTLIAPGSIAACVPAFEALLDVMRRRGVKDEHLWSLLWPLVVAGYWGELGSLNRHRDAALNALAKLSGMALAKRLGRFLGKRLALAIGIAYGILRFKTTPKRFRPRSFLETMQRFFSAVTMSAATASSAYDPHAAWTVVAYLDPLVAMPKESAGGVAREFALATAELSAGFHTRSAQRYGWILELLATRTVFDPTTQGGFVDGSSHGRAQAAAMAGATDTLELAEEVARRHPFFMPHVETIKMTYHGLRGEKELAALHRKQAETLALQGGLSWSAFTVIAQRSAYIAMLSQDTLGVLQASADLERLAGLAPNALLYRDLCQAYVMMARGKLKDAVEIYEAIAASPHASLMRAWEVDRSFYAEALLRLGRVQEAKAVCEEAIKVRSEQGALAYALRVPTQQLALAEARLGDFATAKQRLEDLSPAVALSESPLSIGSLRRDQARIALLERDAAAFEHHFAAMLEAFRKTRNNLLIQQCRRLLAEAEKWGVVATPDWERHELISPANTQELSSQAPEMTELLETYS
jgi:tRNA A-37 threonylcarbamoyl transferase component Bud32/tetratricopeptide (TPR) repeat protein